MKLNMNVKRLSAWLMAWLAANGTLLAAESGHPPMVGTNEMGISLSIRCTNAVWKVGDEIPIEFLITNHGANGYEYANRTDESVKALKSLLGDPDERIRSGVKRAINTAYHYRGRWTGRPLKPDGFDQADGK